MVMKNSVKPVILCLSAGGDSVAKTLAKSQGWVIHGRTGRVKTADVFFDNTLEHIASLFCAGTPIIGLCAAGILIRAVAPHLRDKKTEPAIIAISEDGKSVIPLLGGHHGGNNLAREIATDLNGHAGITTAGDIAFGVALDEPPIGWRLGNPHDAAGFMANILSARDAGVAVEFQVETDEIKTWLAPLLNPTAPHLKTNLKITCTDKPLAGSSHHLIFHPQNLALGLGCIRGAELSEIWDLITDTLRTHNLSPFCIACLGSLDVKADEAALNAVAIKLNIPYRVFSAAECETQKHRLTSPSKTVFAEVGCHSVSEASAMLIANGDLIVPKQKSINATCALAKSPAPITEINGRKRGQLALIGIGPGQAEWRTPEASRLIAKADELVGYGFYIDLLGAAARGKTHKPFP
nr:cobalamin biosynthesis protein [Pseudomonadota bacterium]